MKKKNKIVYFVAVGLSIAMITASSSIIASVNEDFEKNVKVVKIKSLPTLESLEISGRYEPITMPKMIATDTQITSGDEDEFEPTIGMDGDGDFLLAYTFEEDITSNRIPWRFSNDGGSTWDPGIYYEIEGIESHPAISYRGIDKKFVGTLQGDPIEGNGAIQHTFTCDDPTDSGTYELVYIEWGSSYPYSDRRIPDVSGYSLADKPWWYGMMAVVGTRADPGAPDMPIFNYDNYEEDGSGWSSYFSEYSGCENVAIDVDLTNGYYYATFDYLDINDWDILVMRGDCNGDGGTPDEHPLWFDSVILGDTENTKYPAVAAHENQVIILTQSDAEGTQDIICYYSSDAGETWDMSIVADDPTEDEVYPTIISYGMTATCTFIMNGDLYSCGTEDGGETWDAPVQINDENGAVESESRNCDITTNGNTVWADNRNGNLDIYFETIGGQPPHPSLEIGEITGGIGKVNAVISNVGDTGANDVNWSISVTGGILGRIDVLTEDTIASLGEEEDLTVSTDSFIFGLGTVYIVVTASCTEAIPTSVEKTAEGVVLIFFVTGIE